MLRAQDASCSSAAVLGTPAAGTFLAPDPLDISAAFEACARRKRPVACHDLGGPLQLRAMSDRNFGFCSVGEPACLSRWRPCYCAPNSYRKARKVWGVEAGQRLACRVRIGPGVKLRARRRPTCSRWPSSPSASARRRARRPRRPRAPPAPAPAPAPRGGAWRRSSPARSCWRPCNNPTLTLPC